jgi:hypothetical protein
MPKGHGAWYTAVTRLYTLRTHVEVFKALVLDELMMLGVVDSKGNIFFRFMQL